MLHSIPPTLCRDEDNRDDDDDDDDDDEDDESLDREGCTQNSQLALS
jgi:hypothetical protein